MKIMIFLLVFLPVQLGFSQNSKFIDTGIDSKMPYEDHKYNVCYDKFGDGFTRLEGLRLQYFNDNLEKVWEKELELVSGIGKLNWFVTNNNGEEMIIAQYGTAFKVDNIDARLIKVDKDGQMKIIDLGAILNFRGIGGYEFFKDGFMMHAIEARGTVTPYGNTLKFYTHTLHFDYDLNLQGNIVTLPAFTEDEKYNYYWVYSGLQDGNYAFTATYYLSDGNPSEKNEDQGKEKRIIEIDKSGKIISDDTKKHPDCFLVGLSGLVVTPINFDQGRYRVLLEGEKLAYLRHFSYSTDFKEVIVEKDGVKSDNLTTRFHEIVNPKLMSNKRFTPTLEITNVIEDKINDNLVLIAHTSSYYKYYVIILNEDLSISYIMTFKSYEVSSDAKNAEREFFLYFDKKDEFYGKLPSGYKDNAFTKMAQYEGKVMHTLLDYEGYQLLITDNFKDKTTEVTKFEY